jgi:hypothetical protein
MDRQRNSLGGLTGGIFLIGLAIAIFFSGGHFFLPIFFATLAFCSLIGSLVTLNPRGFYGGLQGFAWLLGLGILFLPGVGFWPWILVLCGISTILGILARPIMAGILGMGILGATSMANQQPQPTYQPPSTYEPYQQGYQPQPPAQSPETYQEGGQQYPYQPQPQYEQPQVQYPQELPPQQQ